MIFADLHIHLLCGTDDGAKDEEQMQNMLDAAYSDGTRTICATPHFYPEYFGNNIEETDDAFAKLRQYAKKYSDMELYLGNELRYSPGCFEWLSNGACKTLNGTRYLLVDFAENEDADYIVTSVLKLINAGYVPVLAHAERYAKFSRDMREIKKLQECGCLIQVDAQSPFGGWGRGAKKRSRMLIERYFVDIIASDGHDTAQRPPQMSMCYEYVADKCGEEYANKAFFENPLDILNNSDLGKELY